MAVVGILLFLSIADAQTADPLVIYFGDSITEGWMDARLQPQHAYPHVCDSILHASAINFRSQLSTRAGETSRDALLRFDADVLSHNPDVVVIAYGSNDYYIHGYAVEPRISLHEFRLNIQSLIRKLRGLDIPVVLCGLPPMLQERFYGFSPARLYDRFGGASALNRMYDRAIKEVALDEGLTSLDINLGDSLTQSSLLGFDGVHPTLAGHAVIADLLAPHLRSLLQHIRQAPVMEAGVDFFPNPIIKSVSHFFHVSLYLRASEIATLTMYSTTGRETKRIVYRAFSTGKHYITWDGTNESGQESDCGMYLAVLESPAKILRKLITVY